jgi:L-ascorbate metabolism protein UlaG (beta-lactamase superfamily)
MSLEAVFLPIIGVRNNMNAEDAAVFAKRTGAKYAVPFHVGTFDH